MSFALVLPRRPPSGNKPPNRKFQDALREKATAGFGAGPQLVGDLFTRITWFHSKKTTQDVDNIAKNIHDALKGIRFGDDVQIVQCLTCKIDAAREFVIVDHTVPAGIFDELYSLLADGSDHILCIDVGPTTSSRVVFGPIDGGFSL